MTPNIFTFLSIGTFLFIGFGLLLVLILLWTILTRRDELYREKYEQFLEHKQNVSRRLQNNESQAGESM
jgi:hypothetical protein